MTGKSPGQAEHEASVEYYGGKGKWAWDDLDPAARARWEDIAERNIRRDRLAAQYGMPEEIGAADALALARTALVPVAADVSADDIWASIYRDGPAADAWLESNLTHNGHPALARVPLPDGRVAGILDLRPALRRAREEVRQQGGDLRPAAQLKARRQS